MINIEDFHWFFSIILFSILPDHSPSSIPGIMETVVSMPLPSFPWVANVMVHQLGTHIHSKEIECLDNNNSNVNVLPIKSSRKRPAMLVLPEFSPEKVFYSEKRKIENVEVAFQGREYCVLSKKGRRENMEDRYKVITDIAGDSNQVHCPFNIPFFSCKLLFFPFSH